MKSNTNSVQQDFNQEDAISESSQEESDDESIESEDDFDKKYVSSHSKGASKA